MKMPSIAGTRSRGRVLRKKSGVTLARSSDPRQPGEYALLALLADLDDLSELDDLADFDDPDEAAG
jgi:hypothetical protein